MFKKGYTKMFWKSDLRAKEYFSGEFAKEKYRKIVRLENLFKQKRLWILLKKLDH